MHLGPMIEEGSLSRIPLLRWSSALIIVILLMPQHRTHRCLVRIQILETTTEDSRGKEAEGRVREIESLLHRGVAKMETDVGSQRLNITLAPPAKVINTNTPLPPVMQK